jgi:hypothetical protein
MINEHRTTLQLSNYLIADSFPAVLVTDEGLADEQNKVVLEKLVTYVRNGGRVIIGFHFSTFVQWTDAEKIFAVFGLPWKSGDYTRHDCYLSPECVLPPDTSKASFPTSYYMKAVFIRDARNHEKLLIPKPEDGALPVTMKTQAAVAGAKVGMGYLFYIGDINPGEEFDKVVLALSGFP